MAEIEQSIVIPPVKTWGFGKAGGNLENNLLVELFIWYQPTERCAFVI
jgi:hypothetical protein